MQSRLRFFVHSLLLLLLLLLPQLAAAQTLNCDGSFVSFDNNVVLVSPNGVDDTINIQCALDFANDNGVPTAKLTNGAFAISSLEVEGFNGSFEGTTKANTIVVVLDGSIDCAGTISGGRTSTAIRFIGGEPRIRFMSLFGDRPCMAPDNMNSLIHFTGQDANAPCSNDVIFGNVDRMIIEGSSPSAQVTFGVSAWAEGFFIGGCRNTLTGTLKVNRVEFRNTFGGVATSMQAAAQVDINFNVFETSGEGYRMERSNQNTSVAFNDFTGFGSTAANYFGILALSPNAGNPASTSITVKGNTFNLSGAGFPPIGFISIFPDSNSSMTSVFTDNTFNMADDAVGVAGFNISNGLVSDNRFVGSGFAGVWLGSTQFSANPPVADWAVVGNTFNNLTPVAADILFDTGSNGCIAGPNQGGFVFDDGTGNFDLSVP